MKQLIRFGFVLLFIIAVANPLFSEERKNKQPEKTQQTTVKASSETLQQKSGVNASQAKQYPPQSNSENILKEVDCRIDRVLSIISIVVACMGLSLTVIAIIIAIAVALGFFEYRRWRQIRKEANEILDNAKKESRALTEIKEKMEKSLDESRKKIKTVSLTEKPSEELKEQIDEFSKRLELVELFGIPLKYGDLIKRGNHFFYDGQLEQALNTFEKAIEIDPNHALAWANKAITLSKLDRNDDALSAAEKAIEIDPKDAATWSSKSVILAKLDRNDDALSAAEKAIEIDSNDETAWYNRACVYSLKREKKKALNDLKKAIELDESYKKKAKKDEDFKSLWDDPEFKKLTE